MNCHLMTLLCLTWSFIEVSDQVCLFGFFRHRCALLPLVDSFTSPIYRTCSLISRKCGVPCRCHSRQLEMLNSVFRVLSIPYALAHRSREPFTLSSTGLPLGPLSPSSLSPCSVEFLDKAAKCCDSLWVILYLYAIKKLSLRAIAVHGIYKSNYFVINF